MAKTDTGIRRREERGEWGGGRRFRDDGAKGRAQDDVPACGVVVGAGRGAETRPWRGCGRGRGSGQGMIRGGDTNSIVAVRTSFLLHVGHRTQKGGRLTRDARAVIICQPPK
jgi:hypothetical protein